MENEILGAKVHSGVSVEQRLLGGGWWVCGGVMVVVVG